MAVTAGKCPSCGADVEFRAGASHTLVCAFCKHVVVRTDRDQLESLGRVADVTFGDLALSPGDTGKHLGRSFVVQGRVVFAHPQGGTWEEYYVVFDAGTAGFIAEAQGRWSITIETPCDAPAWDAIDLGASLTLGAYGSFTVVEKNEGTFQAAEGELPFLVRPGEIRRFVDLSGPNGGWATLDYGTGEASPRVFTGHETPYDQLAIEAHAGVRPVTETAVADLKCPQCGAPIALHAAGKTESIACGSCGSIFDGATPTVVRERQRDRSEVLVPIGSKGVLFEVTWTVIGMTQRFGIADGETFYWNEFLLYEPAQGFRWLIYDEGNFWFGTPIGAGDVDTTALPSRLRYRGTIFSLRNQNPATVRYVVGEFYWKVEVGERVEAADYQAGGALVSREESETEVSWTYSVLCSRDAVAAAFGIATPSGGGAAWTPSSPGQAKLIGYLLIIGFFFLIFASGHCGGGSGGGGGGGWGGGSGGK